MKTLTHFLIPLLLLPSLAWSQTEATAEAPVETTQESLMINQGNWEISGEGNYFKSNTDDYRELVLSPKLEYFFLNRFSAGGRILFTDTTTLSSSLALGPSLTWYITHIDRTALLPRKYGLTFRHSSEQKLCLSEK